MPPSVGIEVTFCVVGFVRPGEDRPKYGDVMLCLPGGGDEAPSHNFALREW